MSENMATACHKCFQLKHRKLFQIVCHAGCQSMAIVISPRGFLDAATDRFVFFKGEYGRE